MLGHRRGHMTKGELRLSLLDAVRNNLRVIMPPGMKHNIPFLADLLADLNLGKRILETVGNHILDHRPIAKIPVKDKTLRIEAEWITVGKLD